MSCTVVVDQHFRPKRQRTTVVVAHPLALSRIPVTWVWNPHPYLKQEMLFS